MALCDALNVLADVFPDITEISRPAAQVLTDSERKWLIEHLWTPRTPRRFISGCSWPRYQLSYRVIRPC